MRVYFFLLFFFILSCSTPPSPKPLEESYWRGWNHYQIKPADTLAHYGYELIANTSYYLGPKGKVAHISNGMNCQNCHLSAGTIPYGNNYSAVASTYPKFRDRSGTMETIPKRINDCIERSLNGLPLDVNSKEMKAIVAYMHWLGDDIPKGKKPKGSGILDIPFLDRPANPALGNIVYNGKCANCHGNNGEGKLNEVGSSYIYPPVWGNHSYNTAAGLFRLSRLAGFIKANMPFGKSDYTNPLLSDEESWDVAAFINTQPRPEKTFAQDWPDISKKPIDHPFGPFSDGFSSLQHKFGPFSVIKELKKEKK
jgi:thiosulfate dehydrogenase